MRIDQDFDNRAPRSARPCNVCSLMLCLVAVAVFVGCVAQDITSGPEVEKPVIEQPVFSEEEAVGASDAAIDISSVGKGYVAVSAQSESKLKFQVEKGDEAASYDVPSDGSPIICPLSMGDGAYRFSIWENTTGRRYARVADAQAEVQLASEFAPFLIPNAYCDFDQSSACVAKADELASGARNQGDVLRSICTWIVSSVSYDEEKAKLLADGTGYTPDPDQTFASKTGICFDYASLTAAMLRSQGIPCKIVTGELLPEGIEHAWNLVYIDGAWRGAKIDVFARSWTLIDLTNGAAGAPTLSGEDANYEQHFVY